MGEGTRPRTKRPPDCGGSVVQFDRVLTAGAMGLIFLFIETGGGASIQFSYEKSAKAA